MQGAACVCVLRRWPVFPAQALPRGRKCVPIALDGEGIVPAALEAALVLLDASDRRQRLLYTISSGQNPTGCSSSLARKKAILAICQRHRVIVLEDDPYFYLNMPPRRLDGTEHSANDMAGADAAKLGRSYLSLDTDGRVVRLDSMAKSPSLFQDDAASEIWSLVRRSGGACARAPRRHKVCDALSRGLSACGVAQDHRARDAHRLAQRRARLRTRLRRVASFSRSRLSAVSEEEEEEGLFDSRRRP